jgi:hypothetical protein
MDIDGDTGDAVTKVGAAGALVDDGRVGDTVGLPTTGMSGGIHAGYTDGAP